MKFATTIDFFIFGLLLNLTENVFASYNSSCGWDKSPVSTVYEGVAAVETYPWLGVLYYPLGKTRFTTSVVLVTRQLVLAAAGEIDKMPKNDFRSRVRVVLGSKCEKDNEIRARDYTYHPDYNRYSFSALAMIQLEVDGLTTELRPICQPPSHFLEPQFYAMTLLASCKNPKVRIHRMKYVNIEACRNFYRRSGLDAESVWPRYTACARAVSGRRCVWRSGVVLAVKQHGRWRLLGFSVYGPGCGAPARFLDYGAYHGWVRRNAGTVGQPAITRMARNYIVMRRALSKIQRYGPCDYEEKSVEIYSDKVVILYQPGNYHAKYNVSIYSNIEYSCILFKARSLGANDYKELGVSPQPPDKLEGYVETMKQPLIRLKRWCATSTGMCHGFQHLQIDFYVDITFSQSLEFDMKAYGKEPTAISGIYALKYANVQQGQLPGILNYTQITALLSTPEFQQDNKWFTKTKTKI